MNCRDFKNFRRFLTGVTRITPAKGFEKSQRRINNSSGPPAFGLISPSKLHSKVPENNKFSCTAKSKSAEKSQHVKTACKCARNWRLSYNTFSGSYGFTSCTDESEIFFIDNSSFDVNSVRNAERRYGFQLRSRMVSE